MMNLIRWVSAARSKRICAGPTTDTLHERRIEEYKRHKKRKNFWALCSGVPSHSGFAGLFESEEL
jgi:hypothetical protein